jgi:serine protease inhibitor
MRTIAAVLAVAVAACAPPAVEEPGAPPDPIPVAAELDPETAQWVAAAVNELGFDLLGGLHDVDNVILSPVSVSVLLAMIANGAAGETADAIRDVLHVADRDEADVNAAYASLLALLSRTDEVELAIASSLWAGQGTPFEQAYLDRVTDAFAAELDEVDLGAAETAERIDAWVRRETSDLIEGIAEDLGLPDPNAVLVLLNAVYFKGAWTEPFRAEQTREGDFHLADGTTVTVPFMQRDDEIAHGAGDGFEVVRLPYGDDERFAMEIFLPDGALADFALDQQTWAEAVAGLAEQRVMLTLPRFELEYTTEGGALDDVLDALGMGIAYTPGSDFTRMSPADPWLSTVAHKTYIAVDEEGTQAAAVTGGSMVTSMPPEFHVDRPFAFTISDAETGVIVFLGSVEDPAG